MIVNDEKSNQNLLQPNIFRNEELTENGEKLFTQAIKGRISFLRSNNPLSFPFRLYPMNVMKTEDLPKFGFRGDDITKNYQVEKVAFISIQNDQKIIQMRICY